MYDNLTANVACNFCHSYSAHQRSLPSRLFTSAGFEVLYTCWHVRSAGSAYRWDYNPRTASTWGVWKATPRESNQLCDSNLMVNYRNILIKQLPMEANLVKKIGTLSRHTYPNIFSTTLLGKEQLKISAQKQMRSSMALLRITMGTILISKMSLHRYFLKLSNF